MKIAVLADIHGNFTALQAVTTHLEQWQPDHVVVAGDIVNRGPRSLDCLRFVQSRQRTHGWLTLRGNHEDYVISHAQPDSSRTGPMFEAHRSSYWTYQQLDGDVSALTAMPFEQRLPGPEGGLLYFTHASIVDNRSGIYALTPDDELREKIEPSSALFCVGHTHWPLIRRLNHTLVVNVGAVGLPFDGDIRASYAQIHWRCGQSQGEAPHSQRPPMGWSAEIIRLDYDRQQAERDFFESGFMTDSGALAPIILDEFRTARSHLFQWVAMYQARVLAGELTMEDSTREFMAKIKGDK